METTSAPRTFKFENRPHLLIVEAPFYADIAAMQMQGALDVLKSVNATQEVVSVPGALEIAAAMTYAFRGLDYDSLRKRYDGYIALGCVIKGGTMHDEIVGFESARALQEIAVRHSLALGNGILTCANREQALERADPLRMNKGGQAAETALRMIELKYQFNMMPKRRWFGPRRN